MIKYNFHTHSEFCDGQECLEKYVIAAIENGLNAIGFSPHSPLPFENPWSISHEKINEYLQKAGHLKEKYKDKIEIYTGIEFDYIPGYSDNLNEILKIGLLDYSIGSVHLVKIHNSNETWFIDGKEELFFKGIERFFNNNAKKAVELFYEQTIEMINTQKFDIIGHFDKVKMHNKQKLFSTSDKWYKEIVHNVLLEIKAHDIIVELNTRGVYTGKTNEYFPSVDILKQCLLMDIPVMVNTDAHKPDQIDIHFVEAVNILKELGYKKARTPFFDVNLA